MAFKLMIMCIKETATMTYCGRCFEHNEAVFENARYAINFYKNGDVMRTCPTCTCYAEAMLGDTAQDLSHISTKGIKGL